ncbi:MAG: hypothetical protein AB3N16_05335, partial [Flavobacteriaceae bacterium]
MDLSGQSLTSVPSEVFEKYPRLKKINLRNNKFSEFPYELSRLKEIRTILLSNNRIDTLLASELARFDVLEVLDLDNNQIRILQNIKNWDNLKMIT